MKKLHIIFIFSFLILSSFLFNQRKKPPYITIADKITANTINIIEKKYPLTCIGEGGGMMKCVEMMSISFTCNRILEKNEARRLIVDAAEIYLNQINSNEQIRPYLKNYPFTIENIEIRIFISDAKGYDVYDPNIAVVSVIDKNVLYKTQEKDQKYGYKSRVFESYEEAKNIVKGKDATPPNDILSASNQ